MLCIATLLALAMSLTEGINGRAELWRGPPDEHGHRGSARYYVDHWLPPRVGDPATLESYSRDYGYSYINDTDPVYFFAGRFAALISPIVANPDLGFRLFNVMLLGILALVCALRPAAWPVFAPLLLTPQVWYIFSYFNGDGLPLFLSVLLAYQAVAPGSAFNRYLDRPGVWRGAGGLLLFGALAALLVLSKKNYLAFLAFLPALIAVRRLGVAAGLIAGAAAIATAAVFLKWFSFPAQELYTAAAVAAVSMGIAIFVRRSSRGERARILVKLGAGAVVALAFAMPRYAWDVAIHGSLEEKMKAQGVLQEKIAKPDYKPSQVYQSRNQEATYPGLELRARGTPLSGLFAPRWNWHVNTFTSATGSYGWLQFNSPKPYAILLIAAWLALFATYAWAIARSRDAAAVASFGFVLAFSALTVGVALFHSWNNDFQAQGRYLFPVVAMLGAGLLFAQRWIAERALAASVAACFLLSAYSFVFIGLWQVERSF